MLNVKFFLSTFNCAPRVSAINGAELFYVLPIIGIHKYGTGIETIRIQVETHPLLEFSPQLINCYTCFLFVARHTVYMYETVKFLG